MTSATVVQAPLPPSRADALDHPSARPAEPDLSTGVRYIGTSDWAGTSVWVERDGVRTALRYHGEALIAGFAWGRRGLAPRELARSLLIDATDNPMVADRHCRQLTHEIVSKLPRAGFELRREDLLDWLARGG
jgi:Family of unknown function (DUF6166)